VSRFTGFIKPRSQRSSHSWLGATYFAVVLSDRRKNNGGLKRVRTRFAIPQVPYAAVINML